MADSAGSDVPLRGDFSRDGEYSVDIEIGGGEWPHAVPCSHLAVSPFLCVAGQPVSLLIDTGSSDAGVFAKGCHGCPTNNVSRAHIYDPHKSPNAELLGCAYCDAARNNTQGAHSKCSDRGEKEKQCTFLVQYEDKSGFSAAMWRDDFTIGSMQATRSAVGGIYRASWTQNPPSVDGIIGLADQKESDSGGCPIV